MAKSTNDFGQDMALIKSQCRPIWNKFLKETGISEIEAENNDWDFSTFCEEVALDLRAADAKN